MFLPWSLFSCRFGFPLSCSQEAAIKSVIRGPQGVNDFTWFLPRGSVAQPNIGKQKQWIASDFTGQLAFGVKDVVTNPNLGSGEFMIDSPIAKTSILGYLSAPKNI
jgi:hypothetical protein